MKILHTGDWHIGQFQGPTRNGENVRFLDICKCLDGLVEAAKSKMPDFIVIAGDVFHQARVWSDRGLKESQTAIKYIRELEKVAPVVIVRGTPNHDSEEQYKMLDTAFDGDDSVHVITTPVAMEVFGYHGQRLNVAALPGFDRGYFRAKMPALDKQEENEIFTQYIDTLIKGLKAQCSDGLPNVLVSHYTIEGANMESGQTAFFSQFEPCVYTSTLQAADFDLTCFGHIHRPQQLDGCKNAYYCGAVSALNFNDEGQERGFYIHDIAEDGAVNSEFVALPTREFKTIYLEDKDIADFVAGIAVAATENEVAEKIVRVLYNCTDEHNKALNKTLMEQQLYEMGAFWVQEITPQKITVTVSKNALKDDDSPEDNLRAYLAEREVAEVDAGRIIERALPIISEAVEKNLSAKTTGTFTPVEIAVKNYRNYKEETFSFEAIRFCTINGENGAGKSSLFMDAMCDCLFEETREGDISGWISNNPDARSGSIQFTFRLGEALYRVTRTRMKSGKATLNLAEMVDGEWKDRSCEKIRDTQQEILNTIGMDSLTLKATALIMQDQYGLFLTADKDARMNILANILGLGAYEDMQVLAWKKLTDVSRDIRIAKEKTAILLDGTQEVEEIEKLVEAVRAELEGLEATKKDAAERANSLKLALSVMEDAAQRVIKINSQIMTLSTKKATAEATITAQRGVVMAADGILATADEIAAGVKAYHDAQEQEKALLGAKTKHDTLTKRIVAITGELERAKEYTAELTRKQSAMKLAKLFPAQQLLEREAELAAAHAEYVATQEAIAECEAARAEYDAAVEKVREAKAVADKARRDGEAGTNERNLKIADLRRRAGLLEENNCPYAEEVRCKFLADALEAKNAIDGALQEFDEYQTTIIATVQAADLALREAEALVPKNYTPEKETSLKGVLRGLEASEKQYNDLAVAKADLKAAEEMVAEMGKRIEESEARVKDIEADLKSCRDELESIATDMGNYEKVQTTIAELAHFLEDEKRLPVAAEQKKNAELRITELTAAIMEYSKEVADLTTEKAEQESKTVGSDILAQQFDAADREVARIDGEIQQKHQQIGQYERMRDEAEKKRAEAADLMKRTEELSQEAADLEMLKQAFSQDGIPHNIVRSIVPVFEATATNILGQMSGGKMSVEFVMEKTLKSNSKKEVTALDIIINDSITGRLPYMSRSGGERVKSALAVILALAEIKSTKAGVQLGFLFIDEPPFLDAQGVTAYCDALEAIQNRYADLKVMAITHDPAMKSRFPQSVDIVKTQDGSKVIYA